ncbi:ABC transporter ATP-binding protein [Candidatus Micrarchaeota archaeon]|nr:ABC transporter ATP-binding protein [Candidatus Micrarchaeota archaeon]
MNNLLEIKKVHAGYGGMEVLHSVSLKIKPSEIVAVIGPNGAGKTTLLKSVFNLCEVYSGKILFKEKDVTGLPTHDLIYEGISCVSQEKSIFPSLTVKENLEMGAFVTQDREVVERNAREAFEKFGFLKQKQNDRASTLSGGQQQMLAIAMALMQSPSLLLLDEPSRGLAPNVMKQVFEKIVEISEEGISVLLVEQNAKQAVQTADRTYILEDGQVALEGGKEILKRESVKHIYFGGR